MPSKWSTCACSSNRLILPAAMHMCNYEGKSTKYDSREGLHAMLFLCRKEKTTALSLVAWKATYCEIGKIYLISFPKTLCQVLSSSLCFLLAWMIRNCQDTSPDIVCLPNSITLGSKNEGQSLQSSICTSLKHVGVVLPKLHHHE